MHLQGPHVNKERFPEERMRAAGCRRYAGRRCGDSWQTRCCEHEVADDMLPQRLRDKLLQRCPDTSIHDRGKPSVYVMPCDAVYVSPAYGAALVACEQFTGALITAIAV